MNIWEILTLAIPIALVLSLAIVGLLTLISKDK